MSSAAPSGDVTFLFTDIEGSTRRWERNPLGMRRALVTHDRIVQRAIVDRRGYVFKTFGDEFCAAFANARMPSKPRTRSRARSRARISRRSAA